MLMEALAAVLGVVEEGAVLKGIITRHTLADRLATPVTSAFDAATPACTGGVVRRVLVAEDNKVNQLIVERILQRAGWTVVTVGDGAAAAARIAAERFDVILMDCEMPGMNGYAATENIRRAEGRSRHTPILALTSTTEGDRERCLAAGMDDYVSKPIEGNVLVALMERWCPSIIGGPPKGATTTFD
jgi:CheY-like chemotaxis protein